jgi:two-component system response regulator DesR
MVLIDIVAAPGRISPVRIVVAEDNEDLRAAVVALLDAEPDLECVGDAADIATTAALVRSLRPDVVLTDFELSGQSCLSLMSEAQLQSIAYIVFSGHANPKMAELSIAAGARDFIVKRGDFDAVLASVRRHGQR